MGRDRDKKRKRNKKQISDAEKKNEETNLLKKIFPVCLYKCNWDKMELLKQSRSYLSGSCQKNS